MHKKKYLVFNIIFFVKNEAKLINLTKSSKDCENNLDAED